jgi:hypothetical protein
MTDPPWLKKIRSGSLFQSDKNCQSGLRPVGLLLRVLRNGSWEGGLELLLEFVLSFSFSSFISASRAATFSSS